MTKGKGWAGRGHGIILNMSSYLPFIFEFNPESVESEKVINYAIAPNIGGSYKRRYFSGFDAKEVSFKIVCVDMESPLGVTPEIAYFEQLREPDPGLFAIAGSFFGNANFPPPQVLFQFGVAFVPLVWDVVSIHIKESHFYDTAIGGILGIPKKCDISIKLALDEDHVLNQANQIAKKVEAVLGAAGSVNREIISRSLGLRKERAGWVDTGRQIKKMVKKI